MENKNKTVQDMVLEWAGVLHEQLPLLPEHEHKIFLEWYLSRLVSASIAAVTSGAYFKPPTKKEMEP